MSLDNAIVMQMGQMIAMGYLPAWYADPIERAIRNPDFPIEYVIRLIEGREEARYAASESF